METLTTNEAAHLLGREFNAAVDAVDVARWVRHGRLPGEADARGRVVVDGDGLREMLAVTNERQYGKTELMVSVEDLPPLDHERLRAAIARVRRG